MQTIDILWVILACLGSYLLGSLPFSVWLGRLVKGIDLREHNTGNPGAINAIKTFGTGIGLTVLLLDIFKGFLAMLLIDQIFSLQHFVSVEGSNPLHTIMCILGPALAVLGHTFSVWLGFDGGQGIGTFMGILLYMNPLIFNLVGITLIGVAKLFKKSGRIAGAISIIFSFPLALFIPISPPWGNIFLDWTAGMNGFIHLTQGFIVTAIALAILSSLLKNLFAKSGRGTTNWFEKYA